MAEKRSKSKTRTRSSESPERGDSRTAKRRSRGNASSKDSRTRKSASRSKSAGKPKAPSSKATPRRSSPEKKPGSQNQIALIVSGLAIVLAVVALVFAVNAGQGNNDKTGKAAVADKANSDATPQADPKPEPKPDAKPDAKPEPKPEPKLDPKPEPKPEPRPEPKPEPKPETKKQPDSAMGTARDYAQPFKMEPEGDTLTVTVKTVIDGDTFRTTDGKKVRLIGINTPEKKEELCPEATELLRTHTLGKTVTLAFDRDRKDQYGRLLAYVFADGVFVNAEQVRQGLAYFYEFQPNTKYSSLFLKTQKAARKAKRGLWGKVYDPADYYLSSRRSHRFHRPRCKRLRRSDKKRFGSREQALDTGRSPCGDCKP